MRLFWSFALCLTLASSVAFASGGSKPEPTEPSTPSDSPSSMETPSDSGPRQEAEQSYAAAYDEIAKAKKDLEAGKSKNAEKKFKKALERVERATELDANYHEAWNMVGYCARKLGDYTKAFAAYEKCLAIKPDYAPAHEYLGEAYLEKNDPGKAREQLALLERLNATDDASTLRAAIDAYAKVHPEAKQTPPEAAPAAPAAPAATDSTAKSG